MAQAIKKIKVGDETHPIDGAFYLGTLTTVAGSGSSGSYKSVRWYVSDCEGVTAPYDGMRIAIKIPLAGVGTAGVILSINGNNDADYHPLAYNVNTVLTTHFPVNSIKVFVYDASQKMNCYKTANTAVSVTGVWKADSNYDSNTVVTYGTLEYYFRPYVATEALYRYKFVMLDKDNRLVPLTTTNVANGTAVTNQTPTAKAFRPDKIWWYATTTTISAGAVVGAQTLWRSGYNANNTTNGGMAICNFNSTISAYKLIYLCGTFDKTTGLFSLRGGGTASSTQYYTQVPTNTANITLSSYFTSGYDYILLGGTYSSNTYIQLFDNNPMFHFNGTNLVPYDTWNTAQASSNQKVQGNGTGFGADATVNIVGGGNVTVTGDGTNNKITVSYTTPASLPANGGNAASLGGQGAAYYASAGALVNADWNATSGLSSILNKPTIPTNTNQTVKAGTVTFGANDVVNFVGGGNVTVTGNATNKSITISYTTPGSLKNPNALDIYGDTTSVLSYDGSDKKSLYFKSSTSLGYFTVGDGTTSQAVYVGYSNTDTHYTSTFTVYGGSTSVATFNQSTNMTLSFAAGSNITLTPDATNHKITISATAPAATGYAGNLEVKASAYMDGNQSVNALCANNVYVSEAIWLSPNDIICRDTADCDGIHITQFSSAGRYLSIDYSFINLNGQTAINGSAYIYGDMVTYNVRPGTNAGYDLGSSNYRYNRLYASYVGTNLYPIDSIFASHLSITGDGVTRVSNSYISIYASATNTVTTGTTSYAGILLSASAANAKVRILGYNGIEQSTIGGPLYIRTNYTNINGTVGTGPNASIYIMAGSQLSMTAANAITISTYSSINLHAADSAGSLWYQHGAYASDYVMVGREHNIEFFCYSRFNVQFRLLDIFNRGAISTTTTSYNGTNAQKYMSSLATLLYLNGFSAASRALPVAAATTYVANGTPTGIYATASNNYSSIYFRCGANTNFTSTHQVTLGTTGNSSYVIIVDTLRAIQR